MSHYTQLCFNIFKDVKIASLSFNKKSSNLISSATNSINRESETEHAPFKVHNWNDPKAILLHVRLLLLLGFILRLHVTFILNNLKWKEGIDSMQLRSKAFFA